MIEKNPINMKQFILIEFNILNTIFKNLTRNLNKKGFN